MPRLSNRNALVLSLTPDGMIQDLGPFRSGHLMETDLVAGSAVVCLADDAWHPLIKDGRTQIWFEGNVIGAVNLQSFRERIVCAVDRMMHDAPTTARGSVSSDQAHVIARWDTDRMVAIEITDPKAFEAWSGEPAEKTLPSRVPSGTTDKTLLAPLIEAGGRMIKNPPITVYQLYNGQILMERIEEKGFIVYDPEDPACLARLKPITFDARERQTLLGRDLADRI